MLADVSGEEVENYLLSNKLVEESQTDTSVPTNSPCTDEEHEAMRKQASSNSPIRFF
jgi:monothiol glutaredoxin